MRSIRKIALAVAWVLSVPVLTGSPMVFAATGDGLPPRPGGAAETTAPNPQGAENRDSQADNPAVVPAISGNPGTGPAMPHSVQETSAQQWAKLIKAPPTGSMSYLTKRQAEAAIVAAAQAHQVTQLPPIAGTNGEILYPYGQSWPTVVGSPLHVTVIQFMKGSKPFNVAIGSPGLWTYTQAMAGDVPELLIKPVYAGLHTNLVVTATGPQGQALTYNLTLVSDKSQFVPMVGFYYPDEIQQTWQVQAQTADGQQARVAQQTVAELPNLNVADLDFDWRIQCGGGGWFSSSQCGDIRPVRVFDDGAHTYIQMPQGIDHRGVPSILAQNLDGKPAIINWRYRDGYFIVDGVPPEIQLIAGVGSDARVVKIVHRSR